MRKNSRIVIIMIIALCLMCLGYFQYTFVLNLSLDASAVFLKRSLYAGKSYDIKLLLSGNDPRFYSMLIYALVSFLGTVALIRLYFFDSTWYLVTVKLYLLIYLILVFILIGFVFLENQFFMTLFQKIKNAMASPFVILFLIPLFLYLDKTNDK